MGETGILILLAAFACGVIGSFLAKKAKKKNSYPLLVISAILAVLTLAGVITAAVMILFIK